MKLYGEWLDTSDPFKTNYLCGYCGVRTAPNGSYRCVLETYQKIGEILICTNCNMPTFFNEQDIQVPGPLLGENVSYLPEELDKVYTEIKGCISNGSNTAAILLCRKMLMNIAVREGAKEGESFAKYVKYLEDEGFITNKMKPWVDSIRKIGNVATHEIPDITKEEGLNVLRFLTMLLKLIYEFPKQMECNT